MKKRTLRLLQVCTAALLSGCTSPDTVEPRLVVEGWIENGRNPVVILTVPYHPGEGGARPEDLIAHPARVMLSDGESEWQLYGRVDHRYFPPYVYTNPLVYGEPGRAYHLTVSYGNLRASADTEILPPVPEPDLEVRVSDNDPARRSIVLTMEASKDATEYFTVFVKSLETETRSLPAFMGTFSTHPGDGAVSLPVMRAKNHVDTVPYVPEFFPGERVEVKLCRITKASYDFWLDYQNAISFGGSNLVSSSYLMRGNVEGGLGCFYGYGASTATVEIE